MMKNTFLTLIISISFLTLSHAQTCTVRISDRIDFLKKNFNQEISYFLSLEFEINSSKIKTTDTNSICVSLNNDNFDTIRYSYKDRKGIVNETFICKLKAEEKYTISPCTCCGIFLMTPSKNAKRGTVKFVNKSTDEYIAMFSEIGYDTIPKNSQTDFKPSLISMNCGFRPNRIFIADFNYLDKKYQYENWSTKSSDEKKSLELKQETHIIYSFNYLFLHEDKLKIIIDKDGNEFKVELSD